MCGISLLWGSGWIVSPLLAQTTAPYAASTLTFALAACFLGAYLLALRFARSSEAGASVPLRVSLLLALTMLACPLALLTAAAQHGVSGWVPLLYAFLPLLAAGSAWSPAMIVAGGAVFLLLNGTVPLSTGKLIWAAPALAAVASQAFALRYAVRLLPGSCARAVLRSLAIQCAFAAGLLGPASLLFDPAPRIAPLSQWGALPAAAALYLAIPGTALAYAGLYWLIARGACAPQQAAVTQWLQTLLVVAESAALAHTWLGLQSLAAAAVLAGCIWFVLRAPYADQTPPLDRQPSIAAQGTPRA